MVSRRPTRLQSLMGAARAGWRGLHNVLEAGLTSFGGPIAHLGYFIARSARSGAGCSRLRGLIPLLQQQLLAVAVVAQGALTMAERLTPDLRRRLIGVAAAAVTIVLSSSLHN